MCDNFDIRHVPVLPYRPQSNGLVERLNQTIGTALSKYTQKEVNRWDEFLDGILLGYRTNPQSSTKFTPAYLTFGRELRLPIDAEWDTAEPNTSTTEEERVLQLLTKYDKDLELVHGHIRKAQERQKQNHNAKVTPHTYHIGDKVLLFRSYLQTRHNVKFEPKWDGPYYVHAILEYNTYRLRDSEGNWIKQLFTLTG